MQVLGHNSPLIVSMFSIKSFKLFHSKAQYMWCFHVKKVKDIENESTISLPDTTKTNFTST
jgi:hypothetical protein